MKGCTERVDDKMSNRIPWNQYEAVLLVDACVKNHDGIITRNEAVKQLSKLLREYGKANGIDVDDVYRNTNGISMRMAEIERLFNDGKGGLKNTSKLFVDTVALYNNEKAQFNNVLEEAKRMTAVNKSNKMSFLEWLKTQNKLKPSPDRIVELLEEGSSYAVAHKVSQKSFWEMQDSKEFEATCRKLLGLHLFRVIHRSTARALDKCYAYYKNFLAEVAIPSAERESAVEAKNITLLTREKEMIKEQETNIPVVAFPGIRTGTDAKLAEKYPVLFKRIYSTMKEYGNISVSAQDVLDKVGKIARLSTVKRVLDYASWCEHIGSNYRFSTTPINYVLPEDQSETQPTISGENEFYHWLETTKAFSSADCSRYTSGINVISRFLKNECQMRVDVYMIQDSKIISGYFDIVEKHPSFTALANSQKERLSASMRLYTDYLMALEGSKNGEVSSVVRKRVTVDPQQMSELLAYIKTANDGVSFNDIRSKFPGVKPGALKTMLDTDNAVLMNSKYYYKSNIEDFDETADIILATLQSQFQRNAGYTSAKMLYDELHARLEDFFFDNGGFDSSVELYDLTRHLFEKVKYKGNSYIFAENKHIWENEPNYTKSYLGILSNWAKQQNNIMTRDEMIEKLVAMGSTSPTETFSYLMLNENQNPTEKTFLMYDEYRYVLTDVCHIDDSFIASLRMSLEELFEGDDYLAFDDIDDFFYTTLPELPSGVIWTVHMIKSILAFFDVGFFTVAVGGKNDIKVPDAAIVRKNSMYKSFSDILWTEINREYELPKEFSSEEFRQILLHKGFIHEREKMYSVHTTVEGDLRYFWTDNNSRVTVSKK